LIDPGTYDIGALAQEGSTSRKALVLAREHLEDDAHLLEVVLARGPVGRFPRPRKRRQQDGCEDADDGDHHQQLDEGETLVFSSDDSPNGEEMHG
jgi:hypothetical protein